MIILKTLLEKTFLLKIEILSNILKIIYATNKFLQ